MSSTSATLKRVANVIVPSKDVDAQVAFYTEKLGLEKAVDIPMGDGYRWVEVKMAGADPSSTTTIALPPPGPNGQAGGKETGITFQTEDIEGLHATLKERGVAVDAEISVMGDPVPPMFWFRDPEANVLLVVG